MEIELNRRQIRRREKWVKDLLSGDYEQGSGSLKQIQTDGTVTHCCLGVACERIGRWSYDMRMHSKYGGPEKETSNGGKISASRARRKLGLTNGDQQAAMRWNDHKGYSFERIADFVAYATVNNIGFDSVNDRNVPEGLAQSWPARWRQGMN